MPTITSIQASAKLISRPEHRLNKRRVYGDEEIQYALEAALSSGKPVIRVIHGGSVSGFISRAETEGCVTVAFEDGKVWQCIKRLPANNVTHGGVFRICTGSIALFDKRFNSQSKDKVRAVFLADIERKFLF